jgi:hypothetical protein
MAAAAKIVPILSAAPCGHPECSAPVAEMLAHLNGEELLAASRETSHVYNGHVLARAVLLMQLRSRCKNLRELAERMGTNKNRVYRWGKGTPATDAALHRGLQELVFFQEDPSPCPTRK